MIALKNVISVCLSSIVELYNSIAKLWAFFYEPLGINSFVACVSKI